MSKFLKEKEWLTLEDAAKRLTVSLGEAVTKNDIFQLAIKDKLQISYLLSGQVDLLVKDEDALYGWAYNQDVIKDRALTIKLSGAIIEVLSEIVLGVTKLDDNLFDSVEQGYWWSVVDGCQEYRPISIYGLDPYDEYFADLVDNIPLKLRWLVIQTEQLLEFEQSLADEHSLQKNTRKPSVDDLRKGELKRLIDEDGLENIRNLGRLAVWNTLADRSPEYFDISKKINDTIKAFFTKNALISFPKGRRTN